MLNHSLDWETATDEQRTQICELRGLLSDAYMPIVKQLLAAGMLMIELEMPQPDEVDTTRSPSGYNALHAKPTQMWENVGMIFLGGKWHGAGYQREDKADVFSSPKQSTLN